MKHALFSLTLGLVASSFLLVACNKLQPTDTEPAEEASEELSLEKDFGGLTTSNESPMFGDDLVIAEADEDEDVEDPMYEMASATDDTSKTKTYILRIKWGLLEGDSTATEVVDWSGTASITRGLLAVGKTIRFERNDRVHLPRTSKKMVEFTSQTREHFDGLLLIIVDADTIDTEGSFTLTAGSYSQTFQYSELDSMDVLVPVGSSGHEVSIVSRSREVAPFAGGFLAGRWVKTGPHHGRFYGRWINSLGTNAGFLRGIWGQRRNGERVFFGKYIGFNGEFRGLLAGHWDYTAGQKAGRFAGQWFDRHLGVRGHLKGHFKTGRENSGKGFFHGRWVKLNG